MTKTACVLDTHALIWYLQAGLASSGFRFSLPNAHSILDAIDAGEATGMLPAITPVEMVYLVDKLFDRATPAGPADDSDVWTDEDEKELASSSLQYVATVYPEDEDLVGKSSPRAT